MIIYDSKKWKYLIPNIIRTFKHSYNLKQLINALVIILIYDISVTIISVRYLEAKYTIDTFFFSLLGIVLSLFLVFRLNSSYDRWWEGRKLWGKLVNDCRTLTINLNSLLPEPDIKRRKFFAANISNFTIALKGHLRNNVQLDEMIYINKEYSELLKSAKHVPNLIASMLFEEMERMFQEGLIKEIDKLNLKTQIQGLIDVLGGCERIKNTPIPFSHSTFIKNFILIYILVLPFGLIEAFQYLAIPAAMIMAYAMVGIEMISEEIENPFGMDANDLPTGQLSDTIRENIYEILHIRKGMQDHPISMGEGRLVH